MTKDRNTKMDRYEGRKEGWMDGWKDEYKGWM
jgi:hypothetical protein